MVSDSKKNAPETLSDRSIIEYLRRQGTCTISELISFAGVTSTAIRQRVNRLMEQGLIVRITESTGRGRPRHRYSLTPAGERSGGDNYNDIARVLWSEIRAVDDPDVRHVFLRRIVDRMADAYRDRVRGTGLRARMQSLVGLMKERDVPFEVRENEARLPVLTALACPYPDLADQDRTICSMEKMLFSEILGEGVRLSNCRLDGEGCCTFEARSAAHVEL